MKKGRKFMIKLQNTRKTSLPKSTMEMNMKTMRSMRNFCMLLSL